MRLDAYIAVACLAFGACAQAPLPRPAPATAAAKQADALLEQALDAHRLGLGAPLVTAARALVALAPGDPDAAAAAEALVPLLEARLGELPEEPALGAELARAARRLPPAPADALLGLAARIARRREHPEAADPTAVIPRACFGAASATPRLALSGPHPGRPTARCGTSEGPTLDSTGADPSGSPVLLLGGGRSAGVAWLDLPPVAGQAGLRIATRLPFVVLQGGQVIARSPDGADGPRVSYLPVSGDLSVLVAVDDARSTLALAILPAMGAPPAGRTPLRELLIALRRADAGRARRALSELPARLARARPLLEAEIALADASLPPGEQRRRARRALERAIGADPRADRARRLLATLDLEDGNPRGVLASAPSATGDPAPFDQLVAQAEYALGHLAGAESAARTAALRQPGWCAPLQLAYRIARQRRDPRAEDRTAAALAACDPRSEAPAELLRERGQLDQARAAYARLGRDDGTRRQLEADLLVARGRLAEAAVVLGEQARADPADGYVALRQADVLAALGDRAAARAALTRALETQPDPAATLRAYVALGEPSPLAAYRLRRPEIARVLADYRREAGPPPPSPAVIVLDRTVDYVLPSGAHLVLTHNLIQVLTKEGIGRFGEVEVPEGAEVLAVRTHKRGGQVREAEEIAEKESVSAPDLELGDTVELELLETRPRKPAFPGGFLGDRFYFQSAEAPLWLSEYVLGGLDPARLEVDARGNAPAPVREGDALVFRARRVAQAELEPGAPLGVEYLPSVRARSGVTVAGWRRWLADRLLEAERPSEELGALAHRLAPRADRQGALALYRFVGEQIDQTTGLDEPVTGTLARSAGNRPTLLVALLRAAGFRAELVLAHAHNRPRGALELEDFADPVVLAQVAGATVPLDVRLRGVPFGVLPAQLREAEALRLEPTGPERVRLPAGEVADGRAYRIVVRPTGPGQADLAVELTERGHVAAERRAALAQLPAEQRVGDLEQRMVGFHFPGGRVTDLAWLGEDDIGDVVARYIVHAGGLGDASGWRVRGTPFPALLRRRYIALATRRTDLVITPLPPMESDTLIAAPPGARVTSAPAPLQLTTAFGRYERTVAPGPEGLRIRTRLTLTEGRIPVGRYAEFVRFCAAVDTAEEELVHLQPRKP